MILVMDATNLWCQSAHLVDWEDPQAEGAAMHIAFRSLGKIVREVDPHTLLMAWDSPGRQARKEFSSSYKAARKESPVRKHSNDFTFLLGEMGARNLMLEGAEADDIIAWACNRSGDEPGRIWSGDKDLLQLTDRWPQIRGSQVWGPVQVEEKYGVKVEHLHLWFALAGDPIDGVTGVPKVGPQWATRIVRECGADLDRILAHPKVAKHQDHFRTSLILVDLRHDPLGIQDEINACFGGLPFRGWDPARAEDIMVERGPEFELAVVSEQAARRVLFTPVPAPSPERTQSLLGLR